jgi:hypothetical protein
MNPNLPVVCASTLAVMIVDNLSQSELCSLETTLSFRTAHHHMRFSEKLHARKTDPARVQSLMEAHPLWINRTLSAIANKKMDKYEKDPSNYP